MSVLVKGMKMPKTCLHCPFADGEYGWCDCDNDIDVCLDERPDACPLVELPDHHGRLVDAGVLIADIRKNSASYFADDFAHEWVDRQPTIVEAEGET